MFLGNGFLPTFWDDVGNTPTPEQYMFDFSVDGAITYLCLF